MNSGYKEYEPPVSLKPYLVCYWSYFLEPSNITIESPPPIIPDGCIDIIFDLNCPINLNSFVVGAMTTPITNNKTNLIGVRFKPGAAHSFLKIPVHEITDKIIEYQEFAGYAEDNLSTQLAEINSTNKRISFLNQLFLNKLVGLTPIEPIVSQAIYLITQTDGKNNISQISNHLGWSRQHLTRKCLKFVGVGPKFLSQVVRVKRVIKSYKTKRFHNWSQLSIDGGYYDQSHMINEFKKITGLTPVKYLTK